MFYIYRCVEQNSLFWLFQLHFNYIGFGFRQDAEQYLLSYHKICPNAKGLHIVFIPQGQVRPEIHFEWSN